MTFEQRTKKRHFRHIPIASAAQMIERGQLETFSALLKRIMSYPIPLGVQTTIGHEGSTIDVGVDSSSSSSSDKKSNMEQVRLHQTLQRSSSKTSSKTCLESIRRLLLIDPATFGAS